MKNAVHVGKTAKSGGSQSISVDRRKSRKFWTDQEDEVLRTNLTKLSYNKIAE